MVSPSAGSSCAWNAPVRTSNGSLSSHSASSRPAISRSRGRQSTARLGIEPVVGDYLVGATFATELLQKPEGPCGKAAVAAEELRRAGQRPEAIEVELLGAQEVLQ